MTNDIERFFNRTIGYHPMLRIIEKMDEPAKFPPTNISSYQDDEGNHTLVEMALAGWTKDELSVDFGDNRLTVTGAHRELHNNNNLTYHQRGLAKRPFTWTRIVPPDFVVDDVTLIDGVLTIKLREIVPEEKKIKQLAIN